MDDATLASLEAAFRATPENRPLLLLLLKAYLDRSKYAAAVELVGSRSPSDFPDPAERRLVAKVFLAAGDPSRGLQFAHTDEPEDLVLRARALFALGRTPEAVPLYEQAVSKNPTLEDLDLLAAFRARFRSWQ
jgi:transitional endoplasmic reticulum ATPase